MAYYPANVPPTSLASGVGSAETDLPVVSGVSYPDPTAPGRAPYKVLVGFDSSREEVCLVTAKPSADMLRVTRGYDSSPATAKNAGDVVVPGVNAADFTGFLQAATDAAAHADTVSAAAVATVAGKVTKAGDTMTGPLILAGDPTLALGAATKQYADTPSTVLQAQSFGGPLVGDVSSRTMDTVSVSNSQGASLGSLNTGTGVYSLTDSGHYLAVFQLRVSNGVDTYNAITSNVVNVTGSGGSLPRLISFTVLSKVTGIGSMRLQASAPGITSGAAGALTPALSPVNVLTSFSPTDELTPTIHLSLIKLT